MKSNEISYFRIFLFLSVIILPITESRMSIAESSTPYSSVIGVYPTGNASPVSATSPIFRFEYKSDWITPATAPIRIDTPAPRLRNWAADWTVITQSREVLALHQPEKIAVLREPFFLRCQLVYSGALYRDALRTWYASHPNEFPLEIPFPNQKVQESIRPEVLMVPATGVSPTRKTPQPSMIRRWFGAKPPLRLAPEDSAPANVVMILIDTLRADHTPPGGHPLIIAPHLDQLAALGVEFHQSYSTASNTRPSVGSIFTGLHPIAHGAVRHSIQGDSLYFGVPLLAKAFQEAGFQTSAVSSNAQVSPAYGFDRGFDDFESAVQERSVSPEGIAHLQTLSEPFFLYLHYMAPHQPYTPVYPWKGLYRGQLDLPATLKYPENRTESNKILHEAYAEEVTQEDHFIGLVLKELAQQGLLDRTIIWLLSDHGEEFWEHGWNGHGANLYQETVRNVSMLCAPTRLPAGKIISTPVMHIDIFPTLTDLFSWQPQKFTPGKSLLPFIENPQSISVCSRPLFLHHGGGDSTGPHESDKQAVLLDNKKLIYWTQKHQWEFYDLTLDPSELKNLYREEDPLIQKMKTLLQDHLESCRQIAKQTDSFLGDEELPQLTNQEKKNLETHGYLH